MAQRIQRHLENGSVTKGARTLAAEPLADASQPEVIAALRALHPPAPLPEPLEDTTPAIQVSADDLKNALTLLSEHKHCGKCAGPTGWTYEHILAATQASSECFRATHRFVNLILSALGSCLSSHSWGPKSPVTGSGPSPLAKRGTAWPCTAPSALSAGRSESRSPRCRWA